MRRWSSVHTLWLLVAAPGLVFLAAWFADPLLAWVIAMALVLVTVVLIGSIIRGVFRGVFVDERNKVSLSRFQTVLWTTLVLAAYLVMVTRNVRDGQAMDAALVTMPAELLWVLGISATSLVGSPLVRSIQENRRPDTDRIDSSVLAVPHEGIIARNTASQDSSWVDMFKGEEVANKDVADLGKVQMFFFTLVAVGVYGVLVGKTLAGDPPYGQFPDLTEGIVGLLAISHASYLANKGVSRTPTV